MKECLLSGFGERNSEIDMLVLHCSAYPAEKLIEIFREYNVSSHYLIDENGELIKLVDESKAAYHAGVGHWRGRDDSCNSRSIGIELVNMTLGQTTPYTKAQIEALVPLCKNLMQKYQIAPQNVVGHSDIAPMRKPDPGLVFPWEALAKEGIGLWFDEQDANKIAEENPQKLLAAIGYNVKDEENLIASAYAFRRHFLPEEVKIDADVMHLVDCVYPVGDKSLLKGDKFIKTLKSVVFAYEKLANCAEKCILTGERGNRSSR